MLRIYNSLTNRKEEFIPISDREIGIYVCGMTVYDYCHLGHARGMVAFDTAVRYFRYLGYKVTFVRNITDIDDKIIARANECNESIRELTDRFIAYMDEDLEYLAIRKPDHEPRATEYIEQIIEMISVLIERGMAYPAENGDVYYRTRAFGDYGRLSGKRLDELRVGARIEIDEAKDDPLDFVLWKNSKEGEPWWESPWGRGRPGWHIECSAMSTCLLGSHFDIHAGGMDLLFPHHENEIAQSVGATGDKFANVWMHNGYLQVHDTKMSKSLKNFLTIREILDLDANRSRMGLVLRLMLLSSHYRSPLNYSDKNLEKAKLSLRRIYLALEKADQLGLDGASDVEGALIDRFKESMDDDLNTPDALAVVFDAVRILNRAIETGSNNDALRARNSVQELAGALGLLTMTPAQFLSRGDAEDERSVIERLIEQRTQAREQRNWAEADSIRDKLTEMGVEVEDRLDNTTIWRRT